MDPDILQETNQRARANVRKEESLSENLVFLTF